MSAVNLSVPTIGVVIIVSRGGVPVLGCSDLAVDACEPAEVVARLSGPRRAVVELGLADLHWVAEFVQAAQRRSTSIVAVIDSASLSVQQVADTNRGLAKAGVTQRHVLEVGGSVMSVLPVFDRRADHGPFDLIGDVHGCYDELVALLNRLGYDEAHGWAHPDGRKAVFVGDLTDRGPSSPEVLDLVIRLHRDGRALAVVGNHDDRLLRYLLGRDVQTVHGLDLTIDQLDRYHRREGLKAAACQFIGALPDHLLLDSGRLVVAHAGLNEARHGGVGRGVRAFALYGDVSGKTDADGFPIRGDWVADYRGAASVVHGHVVVESPVWRNNVLDIDTGCVFGGALTALRWPERTIVSIPAGMTYWSGAPDR